jgi:hypothetical protein
LVLTIRLWQRRQLGIAEKIIIGAWNVRGLCNEEVKLQKELKDRNVDTAVIS